MTGFKLRKREAQQNDDASVLSKEYFIEECKKYASDKTNTMSNIEEIYSRLQPQYAEDKSGLFSILEEADNAAKDIRNPKALALSAKLNVYKQKLGSYTLTQNDPPKENSSETDLPAPPPVQRTASLVSIKLPNLKPSQKKETNTPNLCTEEVTEQTPSVHNKVVRTSSRVNIKLPNLKPSQKKETNTPNLCTEEVTEQTPSVHNKVVRTSSRVNIKLPNLKPSQKKETNTPNLRIEEVTEQTSSVPNKVRRTASLVSIKLPNLKPSQKKETNTPNLCTEEVTEQTPSVHNKVVRTSSRVNIKLPNLKPSQKKEEKTTEQKKAPENSTDHFVDPWEQAKKTPSGPFQEACKRFVDSPCGYFFKNVKPSYQEMLKDKGMEREYIEQELKEVIGLLNEKDYFQKELLDLLDGYLKALEKIPLGENIDIIDSSQVQEQNQEQELDLF